MFRLVKFTLTRPIRENCTKRIVFRGIMGNLHCRNIYSLRVYIYIYTVVVPCSKATVEVSLKGRKGKVDFNYGRIME